MPKEIIFAYSCIVIAIFIHLLITNIKSIKYHYRLVLRVGIAGFVLYVILSSIFAKSILLFINGAILYTVAFSLYSYNFTTIERSLSVNFLVDLESAGEKGLELEKFIELATEKEVKKRLKHFLDTKYISKNNGTFKITQKGRYYALLGKFLKKYMGIR